ncbi:hypothetical protein B0H11DRAFT_1926750 [Mycena galericulata]|nr:hypothetical protein B0H11DRAFT_1926750 [Mycena galericulata]
MLSASPQIEDTDEDLDARESTYMTTKERRKARRREASRAQAKAKKRRWDPPKKPKAIVRDDPHEGTFPTEDENLLDSDDDTGEQPLSYDELAVLFYADMRNSEGGVQTLDDNLSDSMDEASIPTTLDALERTVAYPREESPKAFVVATTVQHACQMASEDPTDHTRRAQDEASAAETLVSMATAVREGSAGVSGKHAETALETPPTTREGSIDEMGSLRSRQPLTTRGGPAIVIAVETVVVAESADRSTAPCARVFRGYRYIPNGPAPAEHQTPPQSFRPASMSAPSGICGNCKNPEKCETDGDDSEGLCERCVDCTVWGYLCWDHFNGLKDWEESSLW